MDAFFEDISANNVPTPPTQTTMACVAPRLHGGDAGGSPPRRPTRPIPAQCQSSMLRLKTGKSVLKGRLDMKAMKDNIKAGLIPFKTDQEILDEIVPSDNRQNMSGMGRKLPGGGSTSRRRANRAFGDIMTQDQITQMFRQQEQEKELHRKQAEEAQAWAYLASLKADAAGQWA
ncbi:hypothetical protein Tco_0938740 [Tanacetum coccineum]|uniref:Uncharacterized protein n=1 Tax=Tanacetum coccineum TaxID=301880 RepID=A0ABQ5DIP3_9ASTR